MSFFQIIAILIFAFILTATIVIVAQRRIGRFAGIIWIGIWIASILAILIPNYLTTIANTVGIHRGADLVLYFVAIIMGIGFFSMYMRLRQLRREFTLLVRKLALLEAKDVHVSHRNQNA